MRPLGQNWRVTFCVIAILTLRPAHATPGMPDSLDSGWNGTGKVITPVGVGTDYAYAVAVQPDGKVILAGSCVDGQIGVFCAVRYNANGTLDTTWNGNGKVNTPVGGSADLAYAALLQPDGKVLLTGACYNGSNNDFCAIRYDANGTLDTSWNGTGKVITSIGNISDPANAAALQLDGKVLIAGTCYSGTNNNYCAVRYDGGPFGYQNCKPDLDGDGRNTATIDGLINMRVMLGITGNAVISGITFPATSKRNTWPLIRDYLVKQCGMSLVQ